MHNAGMSKIPTIIHSAGCLALAFFLVSCSQESTPVEPDSLVRPLSEGTGTNAVAARQRGTGSHGLCSHYLFYPKKPQARDAVRRRRFGPNPGRFQEEAADSEEG